jgi:hypothetical protein
MLRKIQVLIKVLRPQGKVLQNLLKEDRGILGQDRAGDLLVERDLVIITVV